VSEETGSRLIPKVGPDLPIGFSVVVRPWEPPVRGRCRLTG